MFYCIKDRAEHIHLPYGPFPINCSQAYDYGFDIREAQDASQWERTKSIAWFASNCGSKRTDMVKALMNITKVDSYGGCLHNVQHKSSARHGADVEKTTLLKGYRFTLAMENSQCSEYVTEKVWQVSRSFFAMTSQ